VYHKIELLGRLTKDPEARYTQSGTMVCNFTVATDNKISKKDDRPCPAGFKDSYNGKHWVQAIFWRISTWRGLAETCNEYLKKGSQVFIIGEMAGEGSEGVLNPRVWETRDGESRASFELTARTVKFLGGRGDSSGNGGHPVEEAPPGFAEEDSNIPF
jgi:single-strand DNA-binding protein